MNIQIFGTSKCFDTKKAQRYFKERKIRFQYIDLREKPMSRGEFNSVCAAAGGYANLIDPGCRDRELVTLISYLTPEDAKEKLLENQQLLKTPIVRNSRLATVGYAPEVWKYWA